MLRAADGGTPSLPKIEIDSSTFASCGRRHAVHPNRGEGLVYLGTP